MLTRRFNFDSCRDCTDLWNRQNATPPCVRSLSLGSQGLMVVETGKIGGKGAPSCPCIISWPELVTYANGGAGSVRMSTQAESLLKVLRTRMAADRSRKWMQQPEWVGFMEKRSFNANYAGYFDARPPDTPSALAGQWHFVRRLADNELLQMKQFRLANALDLDFNKWDMKFEYAVSKGIEKAPSHGASQFAAMRSPEKLAVLVGSIAVMFGPQGAVLGIARAVLQIVGFGVQAVQWGGMIEEFGAKVFSARRPQDLDAAADVLADLLAQVAIAGLTFLFAKGVQKWKDAAANVRSLPPESPRVVNFARIRQALQVRTSAVTGEPFRDFPRFQYSSVASVRTWLNANGFQQVANATETASEIWIRTRPALGEDAVEVVRIDPQGHAPSPQSLATPPGGPLTLQRAPNGSTVSDRLPQWGNAPHMHKELAPVDQIMDYMHDPASGAFGRKFTDWGTRTPTGKLRWQAEHITLNP